MARLTKGETIWLVVVEAYDTIAGVDKTLRFSNVAFVSKPTEEPASEFFDPRIVTPCRIRRSIFAPDKTFGPSQVGFGDLVLTNEDGGLDFLSDFAFDGRRITQYRGETGQGSKFSKKLRAVMDQVALTRKKFTISLKDRQTEVDVTFQSNKYSGMNLLPDGLEGVADLQGKPKPVLYGRVKNISVPMVNTEKLIFQISDGPIQSIEAVYDSGIDLTKTPRLWEQETTPITDEIKAIRFGQGSAFASTAKFVAVAFNGKIITSDDGEAWTSRTNPFGSADNINYVGFSETQGLWVAVGDGIGGSPNGGIATSTDGITWTLRTSPFAPGTQIFSVEFGDTISAGGVWVIGASGGQVATSPDGITWTLRIGSVTFFSVFGIAFGRGLFCKVLGSASDTLKIQSSPDGITWTERAAGLPPFAFLTRIEFGQGQFIAAGRDLGAIPNNDEHIITLSPDGITWTPSTLPLGTVVRDIAYSEPLGNWLIAGENEIALVDSQIMSSPDGLPFWEIHDAGFGIDTPRAIGISSDVTVSGGEGGKVARVIAASELPYTTEAQLLDDNLIPTPGTYRAFLAGGYFRLGTPPSGRITADATEGAAVANRTAGTLFKSVITRGGSLALTDIDLDDIAVLDSAIPDELGFWSGSSELLKSQILNLIAESAGAWWGLDSLGQFRIEQILNPDTIPIIQEFTANDMVVFLQRILIKDTGRGIPPFRTIVQYARNFTIQVEDLAVGVSDKRRGELSKQFFESVANNTNLQIDHLLTREQIFTTLLQVQADADAAALRFQTLRGVKRDPYEFSIPYRDAVEELDLGKGVKVTHPRFGLSGGKNFLVIGFDPDPKKDIIKLTVWG